MDIDILEGLGDIVADSGNAMVALIPMLMIPMEICHSILTAKTVKAHWSREASFRYPLFCLLCVLCSTFGGSMMVNFFTYRKPILSGLLTPRPVAITVAAWWLIFYCPMNAFEKICSMKPVLLIMVILKEIFRTKKIWMAAEVGFAVYDGHLLLASFIGSLGAVGGGFLMNVAQMVTQPWGSEGLNNFKPDVLTKFGFLFGFLYVLEIADIPFIPERNTIALIQALILAPVLFLAKCGIKFDPFAKIESILTEILIVQGRKEKTD